jgi:hypothetical protein
MSPEKYFPKPPESIFKYFSAERVGILRDLRIRFTNPATFNDPFEACPRFDSWAEQIADETLKQLVLFHKQLGISPEQSSIFVENYKKHGLRERVNFHMQNFQKECGQKFRVLCFCESVQSPLMWGHYCNSHQGFALEFVTGHPFFKRLAKVQYQTERPKINDPPSGFRIVLTKNSEWSYENEWRIVQEATSNNPYYETLPPESIRAVYFGHRISSRVRWEIENSLQTKGCEHIQQFEMSLDLSEYKMIPLPVKNSTTPPIEWMGDDI